MCNYHMTEWFALKLLGSSPGPHVRVAIPSRHRSRTSVGLAGELLWLHWHWIAPADPLGAAWLLHWLLLRRGNHSPGCFDSLSKVSEAPCAWAGDLRCSCSCACGRHEPSSTVRGVQRQCMSQTPEVDALSLQLGDLTIHITRSPARRRSSTSAEEPSAASGDPVASLFQESPSQGAFARPPGGTTAPASGATAASTGGAPILPEEIEPWTWEWETLLLDARTPADFERLDLSPVTGLLGKLRSTAGGWTPLARLGRALRAGVIARSKLAGLPGGYQTGPDIPLENRFYIILRGHSGRPAGWTEHYGTFLAAVQGPHSRFHPDVVCHSFASKTEAEAYCIGAGSSWPGPLQRKP